MTSRNAPIVSISASATSPAISVRRIHVLATPPVVRLAPVRRTRSTSGRAACHAGNSPNAMLERSDTPIAKPSTRRSTRIAAACEALAAKTGPVEAACSGVPGPLDLERQVLMRANNLPGWKDVPYPALLKKALKGLPTFMENDANCAALAEWTSGSGRGTACFALYTLGTGVGGGLVIDGRLWIGSQGGAAEFGHVVIDPRGPRCGCGNRGCLEALASATAVAWAAGTADAVGATPLRLTAKPASIATSRRMRPASLIQL